MPSPSDFDQTLVIAHRGAWGTAGENTLEAFAEAIALKADMIEFDLRRTRDGRLIAFHDDTVGGVPTSSLRYDDFAAAGLRPPLLEEVLDLAYGRIRLDVELKEARYPDRAIGALRGFGLDNGPPAPLTLHVRQIPADWLDYNGHVTESRYLQILGDATDALLLLHRRRCRLHRAERQLLHRRDAHLPPRRAVCRRPRPRQHAGSRMG